MGRNKELTVIYTLPNYFMSWPKIVIEKFIYTWIKFLEKNLGAIIN